MKPTGSAGNCEEEVFTAQKSPAEGLQNNYSAGDFRYDGQMLSGLFCHIAFKSFYIIYFSDDNYNILLTETVIG